MGFLGFTKGMKIEDNCPIDVTLQTTPGHQALGAAVALAGGGLLFQALVAGTFAGHPIVAATAAATGLLALALGVAVLSFRHHVVVSKVAATVTVRDSVLFTTHTADIPFASVASLEVCPLSECILFCHGRLWTVKLFLHHGRGLRCQRIFVACSCEEAHEAGRLVAQVLGVPLLEQVREASITAFTSPVAG